MPETAHAGQYIVKGHGHAGTWRYDLVDKLRASYVEITRQEAGEYIPGLGRIVHSRPTGRFNRRALHVPSSNSLREIPATAAGLRSAVRTLRADDAERINAADAEIEQLRAQLQGAQRYRSTLLLRAFANGASVPLRDALAEADARLAARKEAS